MRKRNDNDGQGAKWSDHGHEGTIKGKGWEVGLEWYSRVDVWIAIEVGGWSIQWSEEYTRRRDAIRGLYRALRKMYWNATPCGQLNKAIMATGIALHEAEANRKQERKGGEK